MCWKHYNCYNLLSLVLIPTKMIKPYHQDIICVSYVLSIGIDLETLALLYNFVVFVHGICMTGGDSRQHSYLVMTPLKGNNYPHDRISSYGAIVAQMLQGNHLLSLLIWGQIHMRKHDRHNKSGQEQMVGKHTSPMGESTSSTLIIGQSMKISFISIYL